MYLPAPFGPIIAECVVDHSPSVVLRCWDCYIQRINECQEWGYMTFVTILLGFTGFEVYAVYLQEKKIRNNPHEKGSSVSLSFFLCDSGYYFAYLVLGEYSDSNAIKLNAFILLVLSVLLCITTIRMRWRTITTFEYSVLIGIIGFCILTISFSSVQVSESQMFYQASFATIGIIVIGAQFDMTWQILKAKKAGVFEPMFSVINALSSAFWAIYAYIALKDDDKCVVVLLELFSLFLYVLPLILYVLCMRNGGYLPGFVPKKNNE